MGCGASQEATKANTIPSASVVPIPEEEAKNTNKPNDPTTINNQTTKALNPNTVQSFELEVHDDLDIGAKEGAASVFHVKYSRVLSTLLNFLNLDDDDVKSLTSYCLKNKSHYDENNESVKEKDRVWYAKHDQENEKQNKRKVYVVWLHVDDNELSISILKRLNRLISLSLLTDSSTQLSSVRRRSESIALEDSVTPFQTLPEAYTHFRDRFLPMHVCIILEDPHHNVTTSDDICKLNNNFTVIVTDTDEKMEKRRKMKKTKSTGHLAALEHDLNDDGESKPDLVILHFNDVYHIQATRTTNPVGGADRFHASMKTHAHDRPLILFSGDAFSPSTLSSVTKGSHMPPVLNQIGIHVSMIGNHDLDFGVDVCSTLCNRCNFPWLLSNVFDKQTGKPLGGATITKMLDWNGIKIGVMGLAEREWIDTLPRQPPQGVAYTDFISEAKRLALQLRSQGAALVIALTHSRLPNDLILAKEVSEIDLVLGGHDHCYHVSHESSGVSVIKSGSDFRNYTRINLWLKNNPLSTTPTQPPSSAIQQSRFAISTQRFDINDDIVPDEEMRKLVVSLAGEVDKNMSRSLGYVDVTLDATFESARTKESNVGNLIADIIRRAYNADIGLICGGVIRADDTYPPSNITMQTILDIFPFEDPCVVVELTSKQLWNTIENSVSSYPKMDGRFPQISGMRFVYDPARESGKRVLSIHVNDIAVSLSNDNERYTVATRSYMQEGNDGFTSLKEGKLIMDDENGHTLSVLMRNFFWAVQMINRAHEKNKQLLVQQTESKDNTNANNAISIIDKMKQFKLAGDHISPLKVAPSIEGRILTVSQTKTTDVHVTQLSMEVSNFAEMKEAPFATPNQDKRTLNS